MPYRKARAADDVPSSLWVYRNLKKTPKTGVVAVLRTSSHTSTTAVVLYDTW